MVSIAVTAAMRELIRYLDRRDRRRGVKRTRASDSALAKLAAQEKARNLRESPLTPGDPYQ